MSIVYCNTSKAQNIDKNIAAKILSNTITVDDVPNNISNTDSVFYIIVTEKQCSKCFQEICDNIDKSEYHGYKINVIVVMKHDLLQMFGQVTRYRDDIKCGTDVVFHFTDKNLLPEVYNMPSPQLIIKEQDKAIYYPYGKAMNLIHSFSRN